MKLATAIKTLQQQFGLYDIQYDRRDEGQFKPYEFYMITDDFYIKVVHPMNDQVHRNYIQREDHFLPINVDEINNLSRIYIRVTPTSDKHTPWDEYMVHSHFMVKRGDVDFIKNLLSPIA